MECGRGDTVRFKWSNGKGLRERWGLEKIVEIRRRVKTVPLKPEGTAPGPTIWSLNCACFTPFPGIHFSGYRVNQDLGGAVACGLLIDGLVALPAEIEYSGDVNTDHEEHERKESRTISN